MSEGKFGPVQLAAYVQTYVLMLLPNVVVIGAFMFAAAALTRQALATYLGGVALFVLGTVAGDVTDALGERHARRRCSIPFGGGAIAQTTQFWTPAEQNARLIGWPTVMLVEPRAVDRRRGAGVRAAGRALPLRAPGRRRAAAAWWRRRAVGRHRARPRWRPIRRRRAGRAAARSFSFARARAADARRRRARVARDRRDAARSSLILAGAMRLRVRHGLGRRRRDVRRRHVARHAPDRRHGAGQLPRRR